MTYCYFLAVYFQFHHSLKLTDDFILKFTELEKSQTPKQQMK